MSEKAINDGQWNPWRLLGEAEFIIRDLSPDHDFPGRIRMAREAHDKAIRNGADPETAAEERGWRRGVEERDELRALLREWLPRQCALKPWPQIGSMLACGKCLGCRTLIALAPRDSATVCAFPECTLPDEHHGEHIAPRDSGKE